jgi:hypothetical protein
MSESGGAHGQELEGTFGDGGSERVGRIRNQDDQCYQRTSSILFPYFVFLLPAADCYKIEL